MFSGDIVIATSNPCACPLVSVGTFCFVNGRTFSIRRSSVPGSRQSSYVPRFFHYWFHWIHTRRAFLRVLNKELHGFIVLCMHIYLLLQNCVTMYNVPFQNNSSAETYPNGPNAESFLGAPLTQRDASSARKKHQTRRPITVTAISEKLSLNNRNALMELLTLATISV